MGGEEGFGLLLLFEGYAVLLPLAVVRCRPRVAFGKMLPNGCALPWFCPVGNLFFFFLCVFSCLCWVFFGALSISVFTLRVLRTGHGLCALHVRKVGAGVGARLLVRGGEGAVLGSKSVPASMLPHALQLRKGEPKAENEFPSCVAVFLCSAFANTS